MKRDLPGSRAPGGRHGGYGLPTSGQRLACLAGSKGWPSALLLLLCFLAQPARAALEAEKALLATGQYQKAIAQLETVLSKTPDQSEAMAALLDGLMATGEYRQAAQRGEQFLQAKPNASVAVRTAQAWILVGEYDRADKLLAPFSTADALWLRGTLRQRTGDRDAAQALFEQAAARITGGAILPTEEQTAAAARALIGLGRFKEANQLYQQISGAAPGNADLKAEWGQLLAAKHNPGDAEGLFREALKTNPKQTAALVGLADLDAENFGDQAPILLNKALAVNPHLAEARLELARIDLQNEDYAAANSQLQLVDSTQDSPNLESWSLHAVSQALQCPSVVNCPMAGRDFTAEILRINPSYGQVFAELADALVIRRQYSLAVDFYRQALDKDPGLDDARSNLGIQLFRLGQEEEARKVLEEAYRRDPYNVWTVNTLRLMDSFSNFDTFETDHFRVRLNKKESALLWPYVNELLQESFASLTSRYGYTPPQKILVEMFPNQDDFAVRTLGLPGLGALGASFGPVVVMDSPSAMPAGEYHWGSTLWHELGHVITLGMTSNRVPRWFTEGLSVYEEGHARPGWGDPLDLSLIQDLQEHGLIPLQKLDSAFIHPEYPNEVLFAYFQAGMICNFIADQYGFPKILAMLRAYGQGQSDAAAVQAALGLSLADFDAAFRQYARAKTYNFGAAIHFSEEPVDTKTPQVGEGGMLPRTYEPKAQGDFADLLRKAAEARDAKHFDEAIAAAQQAQKLFPPYVDEGNPYQLLADIYEQQGHKDQAAAELMAWRMQRGRDPKVLKHLADLLEETGQRQQAIDTLLEALQVSMYDVDIHQKLGAWYLEAGNAKDAVREYRAALDLDAPDKADAHYRLATAYQKLSDPAKARREILESLEIAPGYRPAQQLLLELTGAQNDSP